MSVQLRGVAAGSDEPMENQLAGYLIALKEAHGRMHRAKKLTAAPA